MSDIVYEVTVANTFEGISPEDAVLQMAGWVASAAYVAGYRVTWLDENQESHSVFIDAEDIDSNAVMVQLDGE